MKGMIENEAGIKKLRRFCDADLKAMAKLIARRHSEKGACIHLGINPESFRCWKYRQKNQARFETLWTGMREAQLDKHLSNIEDASIGAGVHQKADWRASKALLDIWNPELTPQPNQPAPVTNTITVHIAESIRRAYSADLSSLMLKSATSEPLENQMQIKEHSGSARAIVESRKLPPKRKGEVR